MPRRVSIFLTTLLFLICGKAVALGATGYTLPGGGESFTYDAKQRIQTATSVLSTATLTYQGNSGRVLSAIPTAGPKVLMDYGTAAEDFRLKEISNRTSAGAVISQHNYTFTKDAQIRTWSRTYGLGTPPPAETFTFDYDAADRLEGASLKNTATNAVLADHRFIHDPLDNRVSIREGGKLKSGTFNSANQLTAEAGGGKVRITGSLNKAGASVTVAGKAAAVHPQGGFAVEVGAAEGANHLPLVVTEANGTVTTKYVDLVFDQAEPLIYTYDANGNLEKVAPAATPTLPKQTYEWDAADRLVAMVRHLSPTETRRTEFLYNGEGSRVGKKEFVNGTLQSDIRYIYGGTGVLQERSADGGTVLKTFTGSGELDYTTTPATPRYYTRDHLGSVREVVAEDGSLLARYDYKPYGERILIAGTYEAAKGFTGHDYLPEPGMILTRYRAYDPLTGRWLSPDPIAEAGGMNLYGYVGGDPLNAVDRLGLFSNWNLARYIECGGKAMADSIEAITGMIDMALASVAAPFSTADEGLALWAESKLARAATPPPVPRTPGFSPKSGGLPDGVSPASALNPPPSGMMPGCFVAGTLVKTETGEKPIEEIQAGEKVWSYNQESKKWELREVVETYSLDYEGEIITLKIGGEEIIATGNHPIWVTQGENLELRPKVHLELAAYEHTYKEDGRWVEARHLKSDDKLMLKGGNRVHLDRISTETSKAKVFNIHVEGNHNYMVSELGLLVHNQSSMPPKYLPDIPTPATKNWSAAFKSEGEARALARTKLGSNPVEISPGKWRSEDGRWQYRAKPGDVADRHVHLEELNAETGEVLQNLHLRWPEGAGR